MATELIKQNVKIAKTEQIKEIVKCGKDPFYFINTYAKIQHPTEGLIPFHTYPFQDDCIDAFQKHRLNIILKSRQLGLTTTAAAYAVWLAIFYRDKNIVVIATKRDTAQGLIKKVKTIIQNLPAWLFMPTITEDTKQSLGFSNGSIIKAIARGDDAGRGEAISLLIVDEAAFIPNFENIWIGLKPTISAGGNVILMSTPAANSYFRKIWIDAKANLNNFNPIELKYDVHPEHDEEWLKKETAGQSQKYIEQEFLCSFGTSQDSFLQENEMTYLKSLKKPHIRTGGQDHNVWVFAEPKDKVKYVISGDVARGNSKDYSTFHILDCSECEVAVEYKGKITPDKFAELVLEWGMKYNNALACVENNSYGAAVNIRLKDLAYPNLYYQYRNPNEFEYQEDNDDTPGFYTQKTSRVLIFNKLEEVIRNKILKTYSERLIHEFETFVYSNGRPQSIRGGGSGSEYNDDLIMSIAIAVFVAETVYGFNRKYDDDTHIFVSKAFSTSVKTVPEKIPEIASLKPLGQTFNPNTFYGRINPIETYNGPGSNRPDIMDIGWLYDAPKKRR